MNNENASNQATTKHANINDNDSTISTADLNNLSDNEVIDYFIRGIMLEKGIDAPTPEIEQEIFEGLRTKLLEQIDRSLIAELPDDKLDELNRIATEKGQVDPKMVAEMIVEANLDTTEITGATMARFREIYLGQKTTNETED